MNLFLPDIEASPTQQRTLPNALQTVVTISNPDDTLDLPTSPSSMANSSASYGSLSGPGTRSSMGSSFAFKGAWPVSPSNQYAQERALSVALKESYWASTETRSSYTNEVSRSMFIEESGQRGRQPRLQLLTL